MSNDKKITSASRKKANSGRVSYTSPVVIHETRQTKITFMPIYIPRTNGTDLSIKLVNYKKGKPPNTWLEQEDKSLSLNAEATRHLYKHLKECLAISEYDEDGDYIIIKTSDGTADLTNLEPEKVANAVLGVLGKEDIVKHIRNANFSDELILALRGAIKLKEIKSALEELRSYLKEGESDENIYQKWCERHSWAFGNAYVLNDDVRNISASDSVDLLLPSAITGYRDIVELKRPDKDILLYDNSHNNFYFSADVTKAIGQCHRYLDVFQESALNGLRDHKEVIAAYPRATIVIGRSNNWDQEKVKALHGLNSRMNGITVMTYDQLLSLGDRMVEVFQVKENDQKNDDFD